MWFAHAYYALEDLLLDDLDLVDDRPTSLKELLSQYEEIGEIYAIVKFL